VIWPQVPLGKLCDVLDSRRKPVTKRDRIAGEFPYYGATGILDHVSQYIFDEKLVLIGEDGAKWGAGEKTAFAAEGKYWVNNHAHVIRPHRQRVMDEWIIYFLNFSDLSKFITGLTVPKLNQGKLCEIPIPLPPLREQQRIVAILDEAFGGLATATANAEKNLKNARELFDSQLQSVFLNSSADWKQCTLEQVCSFTSGGTPPKDNASYWKGSIPWVSGRDMKTDRLSDAALHISQAAVNDSATRIAPVGALLILVRGMGLANGIAVAEVMSPCAFNQDIKAIHPTSEVNPRFLLLSLRSAFARTNKLLSNAAHGTLKIEMDALREVQVSVPPRKIQDDIASRIDVLSTETQRLVVVYKDKLARLAALKQSILRKAFSGELTSPPSQAINEAAE
jgi:type I restriction enzyme S subunit